MEVGMGVEMGVRSVPAESVRCPARHCRPLPTAEEKGPLKLGELDTACKDSWGGRLPLGLFPGDIYFPSTPPFFLPPALLSPLTWSQGGSRPTPSRCSSLGGRGPLWLPGGMDVCHHPEGRALGDFPGSDLTSFRADDGSVAPSLPAPRSPRPSTRHGRVLFINSGPPGCAASRGRDRSDDGRKRTGKRCCSSAAAAETWRRRSGSGGGAEPRPAPPGAAAAAWGVRGLPGMCGCRVTGPRARVVRGVSGAFPAQEPGIMESCAGPRRCPENTIITFS